MKCGQQQKQPASNAPTISAFQTRFKQNIINWVEKRQVSSYLCGLMDWYLRLARSFEESERARERERGRDFEPPRGLSGATQQLFVNALFTILTIDCVYVWLPRQFDPKSLFFCFLGRTNDLPHKFISRVHYVMES